MIEQLEVEVLERLQRKLERAESSFIKSKTLKLTSNCRNGGSQIGGKIFVCKISCIGVDARSSGQCFDEKARACGDFSLRRSVEIIREIFRGMSESELTLRWPQLGELFWMRDKLRFLRESLVKKAS